MTGKWQGDPAAADCAPCASGRHGLAGGTLEASACLRCERGGGRRGSGLLMLMSSLASLESVRAGEGEGEDGGGRPRAVRGNPPQA